VTLRALRIARADRRTRDFTFNALREAIKEIVARFPVYRTYVDANGHATQDRHYVDWAVTSTRAHSRISDTRILDFLRDALLGIPPKGASAQAARDYCAFAMRFQQFTAPVAAKGVEDTAFYTFNRLVSLNEVGGDRISSAPACARSISQTRIVRHCGHTRCSPLRRTTTSAPRTWRAHGCHLGDARGVAAHGPPLDAHQPQPNSRRRRPPGAFPER
jgi:hypothetical protein